MSDIRFIEKSHQYISEKGELISVSALVEKFKQKVDWDKIAKRSAAKQTKLGNPTTAKQLQAKWEKKKNIACEVGTLFHSMREEELIRSPDPTFYGKVCEKKNPSFIGGNKLSFAINQLENNTVYPEMMIYDLEHMVCGQSDKVIVMDNKIHIWDYKTDDKISFKGYSNEWMSAKRLLAPLSHLEECNGVLYSLKMSFYMYMLWKANKGHFLPGDIIIEHVSLKRDEDGIPVLENGVPVVIKIEQIKLPYRKKEVEAILKTLKK